MKDRDYYIHQININIKAIEQINAKDHKPWNYQLKGLGEHLVGKTNITNDDADKAYIAKYLRNLNKKIDKLNPQEAQSDPDFDKHPVMYTIDDSLGGLLLITLIIGGIIAVGLFFHLALD